MQAKFSLFSNFFKKAMKLGKKRSELERKKVVEYYQYHYERNLGITNSTVQSWQAGTPEVTIDSNLS